MLHSLIAADAGRYAAERVIAGTLTADEAGDLWVEFADEAHASGVAFLSAYDAAGAPR